MEFFQSILIFFPINSLKISCGTFTYPQYFTPQTFPPNKPAQQPSPGACVQFYHFQSFESIELLSSANNNNDSAFKSRRDSSLYCCAHLEALELQSRSSINISPAVNPLEGFREISPFATERSVVSRYPNRTVCRLDLPHQRQP